jgi:hypothetical protein
VHCSKKQQLMSGRGPVPDSCTAANLTHEPKTFIQSRRRERRVSGEQQLSGGPLASVCQYLNLEPDAISSRASPDPAHLPSQIKHPKQDSEHNGGEPRSDTIERVASMSNTAISNQKGASMFKLFLIAAAAVAVGVSTSAFATGRGGGGGFGAAAPGAGNTSTTPPGFGHGEKTGWEGAKQPPGWVDHGNKQGWGGASQPPGLQRR